MHLLGVLPTTLLGFLLHALPTSTEEKAGIIRRQEVDTISSFHDGEILKKLATRPPTSLRKLRSHDPGQIFYFSDWHFDDDVDFNATTRPLAPNILLHQTSQSSGHVLDRLLSPRAGSGFSCPANTNSCASIGADYGCCPQGTTCQLGSNGDLGCCPGSSATCTGSTPTDCEQGYSSCQLFHGGGGCCANGFQCQSEGCVGVSTTVVVVYPTVTVTRTSSSSTTSSTIVTTSSSTSTTTSTTTISSTASTSSTSTSSSSSTSTVTTTTTTTSSAASTSITPLAPIAPTSLSLTTSTTSQPTTLFLGPCPTGFYACSAVFNAGSCCQIGRDCGRTSCPPLTTSTALVSNGVTIADVSANGVCATGWSSCGSDVGGGCCPTGYGCGTQFCSATGAMTAGAGTSSVIAKEGSSDAQQLSMSWLGIGIGALLALGFLVA